MSKVSPKLRLPPPPSGDDEVLPTAILQRSVEGTKLHIVRRTLLHSGCDDDHMAERVVREIYSQGRGEEQDAVLCQEIFDGTIDTRIDAALSKVHISADAVTPEEAIGLGLSSRIQGGGDHFEAARSAAEARAEAVRKQIADVDLALAQDRDSASEALHARAFAAAQEELKEAEQEL